MKNFIKKNLVTKKIFALVLCAITFLTMGGVNTYAVTSLTTVGGNKINVRSFENTNGTGDCTYMKVVGDKSDSYIVIDAGTNTGGKNISQIKNTDAYNKSTGKITITHFLFTHSDGDHVNGLKWLTDYATSKKVVVENLYINTVYFNDNFKSVLDAFLSKSNVTVKKVYYFGYLNQSQATIDYKSYFTSTTNTLAKKTSSRTYVNSIKSINIASTYCKLNILPAIYKYTGDHHINNSCMSVVLVDDTCTVSGNTYNSNFKVIIPADLQGVPLQDIANGYSTSSGSRINLSSYQNLYKRSVGNSYYKNVYYKASHHGKRSKTYYKQGNNFYNAEYDLLGKIVKPNYIIGTAWRCDNNDAADKAQAKEWLETFKTLLPALKQAFNITPTIKNSFN